MVSRWCSNKMHPSLDMLVRISELLDIDVKDLIVNNKYSMDKKEIFDRVEYVVACVGAFAQRHQFSNMQAYAYLRRFTGIDFLLDRYVAEHALSIDEAVSDLQVICQREGGKLW